MNRRRVGLLLIVLSIAGGSALSARYLGPTSSARTVPESAVARTSRANDNINSCLNRSGPLITISGDFSTPYRNTDLAAASRIDARLARWKSAGNVGFRIGGGANVCVAGGEIVGDYSLSTSWEVMHDTYATMIRGGTNYLLSEIRIHNYGDGVFVGREANDGFVVRGAYLTQIRDDAFSNDNGKRGLVEDCLVDGAYVGFSDQKYAVAPGDSVWEIRDTLVRLQSYEQTYAAGRAGHGWFWKWDAEGIKLSLHGNIFFAEAPSIHESHQLLPEKIVSCKKPDGSPDNVIVWGGSGPYPRPEELKTGCFTLTTDKSFWSAAVTRWKGRHNR
jgi:hypothetical protein